MSKGQDLVTTFYVEVSYSPWRSSSRRKAYTKAFVELDRLTNDLRARILRVEDEIMPTVHGDIVAMNRRSEEGIKRVVTYQTLDTKLD